MWASAPASGSRGCLASSASPRFTGSRPRRASGSDMREISTSQQARPWAGGVWTPGTNRQRRTGTREHPLRGNMGGNREVLEAGQRLMRVRVLPGSTTETSSTTGETVTGETVHSGDGPRRRRPAIEMTFPEVTAGTLCFHTPCVRHREGTGGLLPGPPEALSSCPASRKEYFSSHQRRDRLLLARPSGARTLRALKRKQCVWETGPRGGRLRVRTTIVTRETHSVSWAPFRTRSHCRRSVSRRGQSSEDSGALHAGGRGHCPQPFHPCPLMVRGSCGTAGESECQDET